MATVELLMDGGTEALHRVTTVLAHQRADLRFLRMQAGAGSAPTRVTLEVEGPDAGLDQVVKRLRRIHGVREVRREACPHSTQASP